MQDVHKDDPNASSVSSSWREEPSVNGGGWTDMSMKMPGQMGAMEGTKWSAIHTATHYRAPPKRQSWGQETQGTIRTCVDLFTPQIEILIVEYSTAESTTLSLNRSFDHRMSFVCYVIIFLSAIKLGQAALSKKDFCNFDCQNLKKKKH